MVIRRAEQADIPGLIRLLYQVGQVHHELRPDLFRAGAIKYTPEELEVLLSDETKPIFAAVEGNDLLGYCFCQVESWQGSTALTDRTELYIDDLCVEESCRVQGVAGALYRHVLDYGKGIGCGFVTLNVWQGNEGAMRFYEKMGLTPRKTYMEVKL